ncbi:hypothetical protein Bbelb_387210 [Branchiostoma belcheri]|nr:hypothetical protein Bbelb_387210 [Branchiostoma belcheri]
MTVTQTSGGDEVMVKRPFNYDCSFAAGLARRKYFTEQIYYIFSPVWSKRSPCLPPSVFNPGGWSVRLKINRQTTQRRRNCCAMPFLQEKPIVSAALHAASLGVHCTVSTTGDRDAKRPRMINRGSTVQVTNKRWGTIVGTLLRHCKPGVFLRREKLGISAL